MSEVRDDAPQITSKSNAPDDTVGWTVTINRPRGELFAYWRNFTNLATFMDNVERIETLDSERSHWVVKAPGGKTVEWTSRVTSEEDGRSISWQAEEDADVPNSGRVLFEDAQGDRGTIVNAIIQYDPPAGVVGKLVAKLFQREPSIQVRRDLRRFKQLMETGEVATAARTRAERDEENN